MGPAVWYGNGTRIHGITITMVIYHGKKYGIPPLVKVVHAYCMHNVPSTVHVCIRYSRITSTRIKGKFPYSYQVDLIPIMYCLSPELRTASGQISFENCGFLSPNFAKFLTKFRRKTRNFVIAVIVELNSKAEICA